MNNILEEVKHIVSSSKPDGIPTKIKHNHKLYHAVLDYTKNFACKKISEKIFCYINQLSNKPRCRCGNDLTFVSLIEGYREFCSRKCPLAKQAALERRLLKMKENGGIGLQNPNTLAKARATLQSIHGLDVINPGQIKTHIQNMKNNNPMNMSRTIEKLKETNLKKYGVANVSQKNIPQSTLILLDDVDKFKQFSNGKTVHELSILLKCSQTKLYRFIEKNNIPNIVSPRSLMEQDMKQWLDTLNVNYQQNNRSILPNKQELDFYFPNHSFAVELHGLFHHSEIACNKDKSYHWSKYKSCQFNNIQLLQFWQTEYWYKKDIIKSKILYKLNLITNRIHGRQCEIKLIKDRTCEKEFLDKNHIQGYPEYREYAVAAYFQNQIVGLIQFAKIKNRWELIRYATDIQYHIPGLFSRLFIWSLNNIHFDTDIVSFSDNRISNGNLYYKSGWIYDKELPAGYFYTDYNNIFNKQGFMKQKLAKKYNLDREYVDNNTEWTIVQNLGFDRIWDAGKIKWIYPCK
jgi:hypothetical protein